MDHHGPHHFGMKDINFVAVGSLNIMDVYAQRLAKLPQKTKGEGIQLPLILITLKMNLTRGNNRVW
jgi:hypothetical protein